MKHRAPDAASATVAPRASATTRTVPFLQLGVTVHDTVLRRALPPVPAATR